jgi:hypothetical protein
MTQPNVMDAPREGRAGYKVYVSREQQIGRVSSEWFSPAGGRAVPVTLRTARRDMRPRKAASIRRDTPRESARLERASRKAQSA